MKKKLLILFVCTAFLRLNAEESNEKTAHWLEEYLVSIPDFPKQGIIFQWCANLLQNPEAFHRAILTFADRYKESNLTAIAALDARGFIFGTALAYEMNLPLVLIRKPGRLPRQVERVDYALEYGTNSFEIEIDSLKSGDSVLIVDDVMATGGTAQAAVELVKRLGADPIEVACLIEISPLQGRNNVSVPVYSIFATGD